MEIINSILMPTRDHAPAREHIELSALRAWQRYSYRDAKNLCDARDTYNTLADKLNIHEEV